MRKPQAVEQPADDRFRVDTLAAPHVAGEVLVELKSLFACAYHNSRMYERLIADVAERPAVFRLFVLRDRVERDRVVGARAIQLTQHEFVDYRGFAPIHGKRFCVDLAYRQQGLRRRLLAASNNYVFDELDEPVLFGESNEVGALAMHGRAGALIHVESIVEHFRRNTRDQGLAYFAEFLANPTFRGLRLPTLNGVQFVYCRDKPIAASFLGTGYAAADQIALVSTPDGERRLRDPETS